MHNYVAIVPCKNAFNLFRVVNSVDPVFYLEPLNLENTSNDGHALRSSLQNNNNLSNHKSLGTKQFTKRKKQNDKTPAKITEELLFVSRKPIDSGGQCIVTKDLGEGCCLDDQRLTLVN